MKRAFFWMAVLGLTGCSAMGGSPAKAKEKPQAVTTPDAGSRAQEEACVDQWLHERRLDKYGSPEGTMYAGGSPTFNEGTGQRVDRLVVVYRNQPKAKEACAPGGSTAKAPVQTGPSEPETQ